jgi:hypothetical protein
VHSMAPRAAVESWPFEPAEHRPARRETDSESLQRLPEPEFQIAQSDSPVAMTQSRQARTTCFERLELLRVAGLMLVKSPAHQPERQPALAFGSHEPTC